MDRTIVMKSVFVVTVIAMSCAAVFFYIFVPSPFKIINPYHPRFKAESFDFRQYPSMCMKKEVLAKLFPIGTEKSFVDRILTDSADAKSVKIPLSVVNSAAAYGYYADPPYWAAIFGPTAINVSVFYDDENRVVDITLPLGRPPGESVYEYYDYCIQKIRRMKK